MTAHTFLWHDYETWGANPRRHLPAQFAAQRTDDQLQPIGEPLVYYCRPPLDALPDPQSALVTGLTPQLCASRGLPESEFADRIHAALAAPGTIGVGYNSIRFDDEVTRHLLWRNLLDPYAREWQNGNARWDLLDVARCAHALRPQGIQWPLDDEGLPTFRLEKLSAANGLTHEAAHDALSDVNATIALARLIRQTQPRLFDFCLALREKKKAALEMGLPATSQTARPFLHISGMFGAARGNLALMAPLAMHPHNRNEILAWDLMHDPAELADLSAEQVRQRLFTPAAQLPEGAPRLPVKSVHLNRAPIVISSLKTLPDERAAHWGIDYALALGQHLPRLHALPDLSALWSDVYQRPAAGDAAPEASEMPDVDENLYGGFTSDEDRRRLARLRALPAAEVAGRHMGFDDPRLPELVWRWRARNHPETLTAQERQRWQQHRQARLLHGAGQHTSIQSYFEKIDALAAAHESDERAQALLGALYEWGEALGESLEENA